MNLPNKLTIARIVMVPVFAVFAYAACVHGNRAMYMLAGALFLAASVTDVLDGKIARKRNLVTDFGKFADPLADKILTTTAFLCMMLEGVCHFAALALILAREFAVSGLRMVAAEQKNSLVIAANRFGKLKTGLQTITVLVFYLGCALFDSASVICDITEALCWLSALLTVISGCTYFRSNRAVFNNGLK